MTGPKTTISMHTILRRIFFRVDVFFLSFLLHRMSKHSWHALLRFAWNIESFLTPEDSSEQCSNSMNCGVGPSWVVCCKIVVVTSCPIVRIETHFETCLTGKDFDKSVLKEAEKPLRVSASFERKSLHHESSNTINVSLLRSPLLASNFANRSFDGTSGKEEASFANELIQDIF